MMLLVDFSGPMRDRLQAQAALGLACGALIAVATLASRSAVLAAAVAAGAPARPPARVRRRLTTEGPAR
ncbi:MAG: hypothetical protein ABI355_01790, partial [Solirubrobacteraceae bacterium]